ncbi:MAG: trypsin-like peptidase domain-containing protein [Myxococcales bacterium]|nr:trypsin-like peptidase domain-containing protein [Myxococcales bacterium]MCB9521108.1 trypsin-like peptidase domain-containing protein [Myxococcales bacterium]MCB9531856.1 trypsin-like peptidase domain-containing protein [Myxococcales bacterium]
MARRRSRPLPDIVLTLALLIGAVPAVTGATPLGLGSPPITAKAAVDQVFAGVRELTGWEWRNTLQRELDTVASVPHDLSALVPASLFGGVRTPEPVARPAAPATSSTLVGLAGLSQELEQLTNTALESVVSISVWQPQQVGTEFFVPFAVPTPRSQQRDARPTAQGSGVVFSADGAILTNYHVVDHADRLRVTLTDGTSYAASVIGADQATDLALIRIDNPPEHLRAIELADSDEVRPGALCLAIGNPFGLSSSVSLGIVSATGRNRVGINDYEDFIQTDAAINPGNSGGALIDMSGALIGINSAIFSRSGGSQGIGFAIPSNMVTRVARELLANGRVARGWLGVGIDEVPDKLNEALGVPGGGALIASVDPTSPAAAGGLAAGDVVVALDGVSIAGPDELRERVAELGPQHRARLEVARTDGRANVLVTLGERPESHGPGR